MRLKPILHFFIIFILGSYFNYAQSSEDGGNYIEFSGKIINAENKEPLIFANLNLLESNISTISNSKGDFKIKIHKSHRSFKIKI